MEIHQSLRAKANKYREHQRQVLQKTKEMQDHIKAQALSDDSSGSEESALGLADPAAITGRSELVDYEALDVE